METKGLKKIIHFGYIDMLLIGMEIWFLCFLIKNTSDNDFDLNMENSNQDIQVWVYN